MSSSRVAFPKPSIILYRFLDVIKSRNEFAFEIMTYVRRNLYDFIRRYWNCPEMVQLICELRQESLCDYAENDETPVIFSDSQAVNGIQDSVVFYVLWKCHKAHNNHMDIGHDNPALRNLIHQVVIEGILTERYQLNIGDKAMIDTFVAFKKCDVRQYIMSTIPQPLFGNQRLLSFTNQGDICQYFDGFIDRDLNTRNKDFYIKLAQRFKVPPSSMLLVAFSYSECKKAARAGLIVAKIRGANENSLQYRTIRIVDNLTCIELVDTSTNVSSSSSKV